MNVAAGAQQVVNVEPTGATDNNILDWWRINEAIETIAATFPFHYGRSALFPAPYSVATPSGRSF